jgi:hypothetical protein
VPEKLLLVSFAPAVNYGTGPSPYSGLTADFNNDGNFDLWISNLVHKYVGTSNGGYDYRGYVCDSSFDLNLIFEILVNPTTSSATAGEISFSISCGVTLQSSTTS